jgi:hypothetical protein
MTMSDWHPAPLAFEVVRYEPGPDTERSVRITSVLRDDHAIRVNYEVRPALIDTQFGPYGDAVDNLGNWYEDGGGAHGLDEARNRTDGTVSWPLPAAEATQLFVRVEWQYGDTWDGGVHELRINLTEAAEGGWQGG